jgi:uncharacterized protein YndB with AHSA1/START domain
MTDQRNGSLLVDADGTFRVHFDRMLPHAADRVWSALVDPAKLSTWMAGCRIDARVGGEAFYDFGDEGSATGEVSSVRAPEGDRPGELVHTWEWEGLPPSVVTWTVAAVDGGTRVQLTHAELATAAGVVDFACGWHVIAETLTRYLDGVDFDDVWDDYDAIVTEYTAQADRAGARLGG